MSKPKVDQLEYARSYYNVPAYVGVKVEYQGKPGIVIGAKGQYVMARLDGEKHAWPYHPLDLKYSP